MRRASPATRPLLLAIVIAVGVAALVPAAGASLSGDDAEGDAVIMDGPGEEPPRNLTLEIAFVDNGTGEPLPDIPVEIHNRWNPPDDRRGAADSWGLRTDVDGTVTVNASRGAVRVAVDHPDWKRFQASFGLDGNLSLELPLRATAGDQAEIAGVVRSTDGAVLPNATVEVAPEWSCEGDRGEPCPDVRGSEATSTRTTVNGTEVHLRWQPHDRRERVGVAEDGSYSVAVPAGSYRLEARAPGHVPSGQILEVQANETAETDLELTPIPPDSVTLQGVIRDASSGEPIPGAVVTVENPRWGSHDRARTNSNGVYELATKPGHLLLEVEADAGHGQVCIMAAGGGSGEEDHDDGPNTTVVDPEPDCEPHDGPEKPYLPRTLGFSVEADETRNVSLALEPEPDPSARIQGWVLDDETGEPLPDARVLLVNEETGDWGGAPVDENGSFSAPVPAGYHTVRVRAPGHLGNATNVDVDVDGTAEVVLRVPVGEAMREEPCCHAPRSVEGSAGGDADHDGTTAGLSDDAGDGESRSGEATIQGQPGDLGPYDASGSDGDPPDRSETSAPGSAALVAALVGAAAVGRRLRGR